MCLKNESKERRTVREIVRASYAAIALDKPNASCCSVACCGGAFDHAALAKAVGYDAESLRNLPEGANMGLSCGNPVAIAALRPGQIVLDLGSGGGFDVFQAGEKVGETGRVIGVDMTPEMIDKARRNIEQYRQRANLDNVEFRLGEIEHLPVQDASIDVVLSNCVLNLSPDKPQVWREIFRVLKLGGRVAMSDMALLRPLPPKAAAMAEALAGCVAGAVLVEEMRTILEETGFQAVKLTPKPDYVRHMLEWNDPLYR
ncbi:MAG: arsenite methyltransferase, partial [Candidatus Adiutrix sp.]|nr:arsenite methyltransferase [Candidatus Adiutrix sp.]